jgi:cell division protein FtsB
VAPNGRAAILVVVLAAVALSLAYPVREYITQRRQIEQLRLQAQQIARQIRQLEAEQARLRDPGYIEQQARDRLHMCFPAQTCYVIIAPAAGHRSKAPPSGTPWYARLWSSIQRANGESANGGQTNGAQAFRLSRAPGG